MGVLKNMLIYASLVVLIVQFILIIYLVTTGNKKNIVAQNQINIELERSKELLTKLKKQSASLTHENEFLKEKILQLESKIKMLEKANLDLIKKKEILSQSKVKLEELQKQKDDLFAIAVHDIKNPAAAIRGYIELITSYDFNAVEQQEIMQNVMESTEQIVALAAEISKVVAQQKEEEYLKFEKTKIKSIIDAVCAQNAAYANKKKIKIVNKSSINTPETNLDSSKIEEVIDNLLNNAIKYGKEGNSVMISTYFTDSKITVEVNDDGVGLSPEDQKNAFEKGKILTPKPTGDETSSGLGLWIVKKIITDHGGKVWVKSKLGTGSTFGFELPIKI